MEIRVLLAGKCPLKNQGIRANLLEIDDSIVLATTTELEMVPELYSLHGSNLLLLVLIGWENSLVPVIYRLPPTNILGLSTQNEPICHTLIRNNIINGCLPEITPSQTLIQAIYAVANGYT